MCQHKNLISYVMKSTFIGLTLTTILLKGLNLIPENPSIPLLLIIHIKQFVLIAFTCLLHYRLLVHPVSSEGISPDGLQVITGLQAVWANPVYPIPLLPLRLPPLSRMPIVLAWVHGKVSHSAQYSDYLFLKYSHFWIMRGLSLSRNKFY